MTTPTTCPQRTTNPIQAVCRDYLRMDHHPCLSCPIAEHLRQDQQRRRADAMTRGGR